MTSPSVPPDLSKLRINRDLPSAPVRRALGRNVALGLLALAIVVAVLLLGRGGTVSVQTAVATPIASGGEPGSAGASVTANGYVVARTRASVAAKLAGPHRGPQGERRIVPQARRDHRPAGKRRLSGPGRPGGGSAAHQPGRPGRGAGGAGRGRQGGRAVSIDAGAEPRSWSPRRSTMRW